jgi:hypothetical protein
MASVSIGLGASPAPRPGSFDRSDITAEKTISPARNKKLAQTLVVVVVVVVVVEADRRHEMTHSPDAS